MKRWSMIVVAGLVLCLATSAAWAKGGNKHNKHKSRTAEEAFQRLDTNHDGKLSAEEFKAVKVGKKKKATPERAEKTFAKLDKKHTGYVTFAKFQRWYERQQNRKAKHGKHGSTTGSTSAASSSPGATTLPAEKAK